MSGSTDHPSYVLITCPAYCSLRTAHRSHHEPAAHIGKHRAPQLHPDARRLVQAHVAAGDRQVVGEPAVGLKDARIALGASGLKTRGDVEGELMSAMRDQAAARPAHLSGRVEETQVFREPIAQRRVELYP